LLGGSWGSTLALACAEAHPDRVTEIVLFGVTSGRRIEADQQFRGGIADRYPREWARLLGHIPGEFRHLDVVEAYARLLNDPDQAIHNEAAREWCLWESATVTWPASTGLAPRFQDPGYALAFARIVTHYITHDAWLEDGALLDGVSRVKHVPAVLINGRNDRQSVRSAEDLHARWPSSELVVVDDAAHAADNPGITGQIVRALDRFARL
jgi:proline iminopeptidase